MPPRPSRSPGGPTRPINVMIATGHLGRILLAPRRTRRRPTTSIRPVQLRPAPFAVRPLLAWWLDSAGRARRARRPLRRRARAGTNRPPATRPSAVCGRCRPRPPPPVAGWHWLRGRPGVGGQPAATRRWPGSSKPADHLGLVETLETLGGTARSTKDSAPAWPAAAGRRLPPPGTRSAFPGGRRRPAGSRAGSRRAASISASRHEPAWARGAGLGIEEAARDGPPGTGSAPAAGVRVAEPAPRPSAMWPISSPAA